MDIEEANRQADALIQQSVALLTKDVPTPMYGGVSTAPVKAEIGRVKQTRDTANNIIDRSMAEMATSTAREKEAITASGKAAADRAMADAARAQSISDIANYYGRLFGVDMDPSAEIATLAKGLRGERATAEEKLRRVQEMSAVGPLDNTLDWLVNQVQLPSAIDDYNRQADAVNSMQRIIDTSIATASAATTLNEKSVATTTTAQAKAAADLAVANADKLKADADQALAKNNVNFAQHKFANDLSIAGATLQSTQLDMQNAHQVYASKIKAIELADTHAQRLLKAADLLESIEKKKDAQTERKALQLIVDNYDTNMGHPKGTTTISTFKVMPAPQRENMVAVASGSLGTGPYSALENFKRSRPGPEIPRNTMKFFEFINEQAGAVDKTELARTPKEELPAKLDAILNNKIKEVYKQASKPGNIFYEISPAEMIASEAVGSSTQLAKVLQPLTTSPTPPRTEEVVGVIMGEYKNPSEAGQIVSSYYQRNILLRNTSMNTKLAGIELDNKYMVSGGFTGEKYDLTNSADATKYVLMRQRMARMSPFMKSAIENPFSH